MAVVNMPELRKVLNMLDMINYAGMYLKKKNSAEYAIILNVTDAVHNKVIVQITEKLPRQRRVQNTVKHLRWSVLHKE